MSWTTRFSGLPNQASLNLGDSYASGVFTLSTDTTSREWDGVGSTSKVPIAYETLASIGVSSLNRVLRVTARWSARAGFSGEDLGAGVVLYGPNRDDAFLVRLVEQDPNSTPGVGDVVAKVWEDDVLHTINTQSLPTTASPANLLRIYFNGLASTFTIPDSGFGSWVIQNLEASYWYSDDDGTTWNRLGDRAINFVSSTPDKVGFYGHSGVPVGGTPTITFSNLEVLEDDNTAPNLQNLNPDDLDTGVAVDTNLTIEVVDDGGVDAGSVDIQLKRGAAAWEPVWTGDAQQSGYAVTKSVISNGFQYVVNPDTNLPYEETIQVRVQADDNASTPNSMDETYSFTTEDDTDAPTLQNLTPASDAENISVSSNVYLEVVDLSQTGVDDSTVDIYLKRGDGEEWEPVWTGDAQQTGYSVTKGAVTDGYSYDIDPGTNFEEVKWVYVRVVADDLAGTPNTLDQTYRFLTEGPITLMNMDPGPMQEDVDTLKDPIKFDVVDPGVGVNASSVKIWLEGRLIWANDVAGPRWDITKTAVGTAGYNYEIVLSESLPRDSWIRVRVSADSAVSGSIDETYFFKTKEVLTLFWDDFDDGVPWPTLSGNGTVSESGGVQTYYASGGSTDWYTGGRNGKLPYVNFPNPGNGIINFEVEIKEVVESGNAHHLCALHQNDSNFLWIYVEPHTGPLFGVHTYNVVSNSWQYQHAYSGNPLSWPIKIRFRWDIDSGTLYRQVWNGSDWDTITFQSIQIEPNLLVHYGKTWSGGEITTEHEYVHIYWEPVESTDVGERQATGWEDENVLPTSGGPQKYTYPEGISPGVGQTVAGPATQPTDDPRKQTPPDDTGWEEEWVLPTAGGPDKHSYPDGIGSGAGQLVPGAATRITRYPAETSPGGEGGLEDAVYHYVSSEPEIRIDTYDTEGRAQLTGEVFWGAYYYDATKDGEYWHTPTLNFFTGYGRNGKHYTNGVEDAGPVWAPWATEAGSDHRSLRTDFPTKALIIWGRIDLVIFDLDSYDGTPNTLKVWMRFQIDDSTANFKALGRVAYSVRDAKMVNGTLVVGTQHNGTENGGLFCIDFKSNDQNVFQLLRADGRWWASPGKTIVDRNSNGVYTNISGSLHIDSEYVYRVDCWAPTTQSLWVAHVGEDAQDPQVTYFIDNEYQWRGRNYGEEGGESNLYDYWYKSVLFDDDKWLWYSVENRVYRGVYNYKNGWVDTSSISPLIKKVTLPQNVYWLAAARDYIYAVTDGGIWQIHRGTLEFHLAYSTEVSPVGGGGQFDNPPAGALIKGRGTRIYKVYAVSLSLASFLGVSVTYEQGGGATLLRLYDDLVLDSYVAPDLAEDGCYFVVPVPV